MNRQSIVGLFTLLSLVGLFAIFFVLTNVGTGGRYKLGVHFRSASGLHKGALVYESGVGVGVVDSLQLLPEDFSVHVILAIDNKVDVPRDARFIIQAPLTGDATVEIVPRSAQPRAPGVAAPTPPPGVVAVWPHEVLPTDQGPQGTNPATLTDLLQEGQGEVTRLDTLLADLEQREPALLNTLQSSLTNANQLAITMNQEAQKLSRTFDAASGPLGRELQATISNVVDLSARFDDMARDGQPKVGQLLDTFNKSALALNDTVEQLHGISRDPRIHQNLLDTTQGIAQTMQTLAQLANDLRNVTGNPQTQAQLRDTIANIDATTQRTNSLLGSLGGRSDVYGVDANATPPPSPTPAGAVPTSAPVAPPAAYTSSAPLTPSAPLASSDHIVTSATPYPAVTLPASLPGATPGPAASVAPGQLPLNFKARLNSLVTSLVAIQIRVQELSIEKPGTFSSPLLTADRGPQTDFNAILLPKGNTSLLVGANDIGSDGQSTGNFAVEQRVAGGIRVGGGVLYSRLGFLANYTPPKSGLGFDLRAYDLRHPTVDGYADLYVTHEIALFAGERDALHSGRRATFGLQLQF